MIYAEPFSHYNADTVNLDWDGVKKASQIGSEFETIIQRGYSYRVTKIEKKYGTVYMDLECRIEQGNYFVH